MRRTVDAASPTVANRQNRSNHGGSGAPTTSIPAARQISRVARLELTESMEVKKDPEVHMLLEVLRELQHALEVAEVIDRYPGRARGPSCKTLKPLQPTRCHARFRAGFDRVMYSLDGKSLLITGWNGFLREAVRQDRPRALALERIVVFSRDELKQFEMKGKLSS